MVSQVVQRAGRAFGVVSSAAAAILWVAVMWLPEAVQILAGISTMLVGLILLLVAIIGALAAWHGHANVMLGAFLAAFLPVGGVLLWADHWIAWIGVCNVIYFIASLAVRFTRAQAMQTQI